MSNVNNVSDFDCFNNKDELSSGLKGFESADKKDEALKSNLYRLATRRVVLKDAFNEAQCKHGQTEGFATELAERSKKFFHSVDHYRITDNNCSFQEILALYEADEDFLKKLDIELKKINEITISADDVLKNLAGSDRTMYSQLSTASLVKEMSAYTNDSSGFASTIQNPPPAQETAQRSAAHSPTPVTTEQSREAFEDIMDF